VPWYVSVLVDLAYVQGPVHGPLVAAQLIDVAVRAEAVRDYAVRCMLGLLLDASGLFLGQSQATMAHVLFAAGWIVGEYAAHLPAQAGAEDGGDDLDASGLSQTTQPGAPPLGWPATPAAVFLRVMEAYLDPRATNLPEEVQVVYMQNALKALAAAVGVLGEDGDVAPLLGVLRGDRLLVFLQSVHVEVQERAATLRNLLTALGVLPPLSTASMVPAVESGGEEGEESDGGASAEGGRPKAKAKLAAAATADLLGGGMSDDGGGGGNGGGDLMLVGGAGADATSSGMGMGMGSEGGRGVTALRLYKALLAALFAEQLQPVNPRAQRKVPVPEGLDLEAALDAKALAELESYGGGFPRDPDLTRVCFTHVYLEPAELPAPPLSVGEEGPSPLGTPGRLGGYEEAFGADSPQDAARRRWQGTPFYLSSSSTAAGGGGGGGEEGVAGGGVMLTAADLDGGRSERRKGGKKERKKHRRRRGRGEGADDDEEDEEEEEYGGRYAGAGGAMGAAVLREEVMPAGAVDSGSDAEGTGGGKRRAGRGGGGGKGGGEEDALDLKDIDITTPLRPDEVIPRMEHRAAPGAVAAAASAAMGKEERRKHRRKESAAAGASSSSRRRKGSSKRSGAAAEEGGDLIDFGEFGSHEPSPSTGGVGAASSAGVRRDSADTRRLKADAMDLLMFGDAASSPARPPHASDDVLGLGLGAAASPPKERRLRREKEKEKGRGKEKERGHRRKVSFSSGAGSGAAAVTAAPAPAQAPATAPAAPLLDVVGGAADASSPPGSLRGLRFPLAKTGGVKVEYSLFPSSSADASGKLTVQVRAKNAAAPGPVAGVQLRLLPQLPAGVSVEATTVVLSKGPLAVGASAKAAVTLLLGPEARDRSLALAVRLELGTGGGENGDVLLGQQGAGATKEAKLLVPASVSLRPGALSPHGFMALLSGSNREVAWHEGSVRCVFARRERAGW
jgi:hypothetical protein